MKITKSTIFIAVIVFVAFHITLSSASASSSSSAAVHGDPFATILLELGLIILAASVGRGLALKLRIPPVLGELALGIAIGNIGYWLERPLFVITMHSEIVSRLSSLVWTGGLPIQQAAETVFSSAELQPGAIGHRVIQALTTDQSTLYLVMAFSLALFSNLGVILMLFMIGLESSVREMMQVGKRAFLVATAGVVAPIVLGVVATRIFIPDSTLAANLFIAATLCATSVGITARVFKDLNMTNTLEAKIVLGAAVIDDVLALMVLAAVVGIVTSGSINLASIVQIVLSAVIFIAAFLLFGEKLLRMIIPRVLKASMHTSRLLFPLALAFISAFVAEQIGLASIVGAFAAGLILTEDMFNDENSGQHLVQKLIAPLEAVFAPVFFVLMGMQVNVLTFMTTDTITLTVVLAVVAVLGKIVSGLPAGKSTKRLAVGLAMVPRGEVGLIFSSIGKGLGVFSDSIFSALVAMIMITTLVTPFFLSRQLSLRQP